MTCCTFCINDIPEDSIYCPYCGQKLPESFYEQVALEKQQQEEMELALITYGFFH